MLPFAICLGVSPKVQKGFDFNLSITASFSSDLMFLFPESRFQTVKQALHTAVPERLLSREAERSSIRSFLEEKVLQRVPGSLYISGAPGTGKTACLNCVLQEMKVLIAPYFSFKDGDDGCYCYSVLMFH